MTSGWTQNDLEPPLAGTAKDGLPTPDVPVSLAAATAATVHICRADGTVISRAATLGNQGTAPGTWTMPWQAGDLSVEGQYRTELEVTWPGGRPQTFGGATFTVGREVA